MKAEKIKDKIMIDALKNKRWIAVTGKKGGYFSNDIVGELIIKAVKETRKQTIEEVKKMIRKHIKIYEKSAKECLKDKLINLHDMQIHKIKGLEDLLSKLENEKENI